MKSKHITLIGMSNLGKSHWSHRLKKQDWASFNCDTMIEERLGAKLASQGLFGTEGMSHWMGQPYDARYWDTTKEYCELERQVMLDVIVQLANAAQNYIIDTSGSVIYAGDDIADALRERSRVIYLAASPDHLNILFQNYLKIPKPTIWPRETFNQLPDEASSEALARCYPDLLASRARHYEKMAHVTIPFDLHRNAKNTDFLLAALK